ncbi:MAG: FAD:protein FMN transferase, partial [Alphaproteobacteria bacterium]|nr:FAD:protein FMN transferase [Alphaproteobacteria bacterium]
ARRIERKYSRYRTDSVIGEINAAAGQAVAVDPETASLLDYADQVYRLSGGRFDITSGVLRQLWRFDGSDRVPTAEAVRDLLPLVGWRKVRWRDGQLTLRPGMEIDFGGLGKEYAVDGCLLKVQAAAPGVPALVNFGGDLRVSGPRADGSRWRVAIETVDGREGYEGWLEIASGALTTSGDARRFLLKDGVRFSHILDPRTGWPVKDPPRSVTVAAATCLEAGLLSSLAMMHGADAEAFLAREGVKAWWVRDDATPPPERDLRSR